MHGFEQSIAIDIPAMSVMYFKVKKAPTGRKPKQVEESKPKKTTKK